MKYLLIFVPFVLSASVDVSVRGVFPDIPGMTNDSYGLFIGFVGLISAYLFWEQVTK